MSCRSRRLTVAFLVNLALLMSQYFPFPAGRDLHVQGGERTTMRCGREKLLPGFDNIV